jgi:ATP-dependent Clp protease adaptor protein ClpS
MPINPIKPMYDQEEDIDVLDDIDQSCSLVVWNDEVNTFEWVIETLVEICNHTQEQAEQCAMIIHSQGKYAVKHGGYNELKPMCDAITDRGIGATIEVLSET